MDRACSFWRTMAWMRGAQGTDRAPARQVDSGPRPDRSAEKDDLLVPRTQNLSPFPLIPVAACTPVIMAVVVILIIIIILIVAMLAKMIVRLLLLKMMKRMMMTSVVMTTMMTVVVAPDGGDDDDDHHYRMQVQT